MISHTTELGRVAVLIPAWRPDRALISLVEELRQSGFTRIVVVNDGSEPEFDALFAGLPDIDLLRHPVNRGKGAALKTGIEHILRTSPEIIGIVTADADGQHLPNDILRVANSLLAHPDSLILGSRGFSGHVPLRSRFGNTVTRHLLRIVAGLALMDTQTGLRGIPASFAAQLPQLAPNGYEFELEMLLAAREQRIGIHEEPIRTIYEPGNSSSHFNPLRDSFRICHVLLRLAFILFAAAAIDCLVFGYTVHHGLSILSSQVLAGVLAAVFTLSAPIYRSAAVRKRFLAVTILLGTVSFAAIELIVRTQFVTPRRTKFAVEIFVFLANLVLQRDWVLRRQFPAPPPGTPRTWRTLPLWLLILGPLAIEAAGVPAAFRGVDLWLADGIHRFGAFTIFWLAIAVTFGLFARRWLLAATATAVIACSIYAVGIAPVATVLLFVFSCTVLGRLLFLSDLSGPLAMLGGLAIWITLLNLVARLPVHYTLTYLAALLLPVMLGLPHARRLATQWLSLLRPRHLQPSEFFSLCLSAYLLTAIWMITLAPEVSTDGLAMHLNIPAGMALHHAFTEDFHHFVWALMPMGADFCYSVVYMLGGEYAARLLNFAMLAGTTLLIFQAARSFVSSAAALLLTALFLSTPIAYLVTGSLFIENFVAFMALGAVAALWRFHDKKSTRSLLLAALLTGALLSLETGALAIGLPGIVMLMILGRRRPVMAAAAALLAVGIGAIPYAHAWFRTGNPFFPFDNPLFHSSLANIRDKEFAQPLTWHTPWDLTFLTSRYFEGQAGSFGFQYLLFLPVVAAGAFAARSFRARSVILLGIASGVAVAAVQPNARYFYFAMPLLIAGTAAAFAWLRTFDRWLFRTAIAVAAMATFANIWFLPTADWYHRDFYTAPLFSAAGRARYLHELAPVREVTAWIDRNHPTEPVVMIDSSDIAGLVAPVYTDNWHDYSFVQQIHAAHEPDRCTSSTAMAFAAWWSTGRVTPAALPIPAETLSGAFIAAAASGVCLGRCRPLRIRPDREMRPLPPSGAELPPRLSRTAPGSRLSPGGKTNAKRVPVSPARALPGRLGSGREYGFDVTIDISTINAQTPLRSRPRL